MPRLYVTARELQQIVDRAEGCCEYCRSRADHATQSFSVEHIKPVSRGGETVLDNLALACTGCNSHKYTKIEEPDPFDGVSAPLYNPRSQRWRDHFRWNENYREIVGLTPTGRATVNALQMNRFGVVNMRRLLFGVGLHPPANENE